MYKHKYLGLNMGLVKENFAKVSIFSMGIWKARGFKWIFYYPVYGCPLRMTMLGVPTKIDEFGIDKLKNSRITDISTCCGTYGMGGPGFFGLKLRGKYGIRWLTYCIWSAGEHILYDGFVLECNSQFEEKYKPIISTKNSLKKEEAFRNAICGMIIKEVILDKERIEIILADDNNQQHYIESVKFSDKFPEQGGTGEKRNSFDEGEMKDYWLITYNKSVLMV